MTTQLMLIAVIMEIIRLDIYQGLTTTCRNPGRGFASYQCETSQCGREFVVYRICLSNCLQILKMIASKRKSKGKIGQVSISQNKSAVNLLSWVYEARSQWNSQETCSKLKLIKKWVFVVSLSVRCFHSHKK